MRLDLENQSMNYLLEQWGSWAASGEVRSIAPGTLAGLTGSTVRSACILDDDAETIDRVVAKLKRKDSEMGKVICLYFIKKMSYLKIAKLMRCSKEKIRRLFLIGVAWIEGNLSQISEYAA